MHDDGLDHALLFYGRGELFELPVVKDLPRLILVGSDPVQLELDDAERFFLFVVQGGEVRDERTEALTERHFLHG